MAGLDKSKVYGICKSNVKKRPQPGRSSFPEKRTRLGGGVIGLAASNLRTHPGDDHAAELAQWKMLDVDVAVRAGRAVAVLQATDAQRGRVVQGGALGIADQPCGAHQLFRTHMERGSNAEPTVCDLVRADAQIRTAVDVDDQPEAQGAADVARVVAVTHLGEPLDVAAGTFELTPDVREV